eukprot:COSAG01_NODE_2735_length_7165_cov_327.658081_3_plen_83_part_00
MSGAVKQPAAVPLGQRGVGRWWALTRGVWLCLVRAAATTPRRHIIATRVPSSQREQRRLFSPQRTHPNQHRRAARSSTICGT